MPQWNTDPDTMHHPEVMWQPIRHFVQAMQKEMDDQMAKGNFELVLQSEIPAGT